MAGGGMSLASVASVVAAEPELSEWDELVALRAAVREIESRHDWRHHKDALGQELYMVGTMLDGILLDLCPHGAKTWRIVPNDTRPNDDVYETCDRCDATRWHQASCLWWGERA